MRVLRLLLCVVIASSILFFGDSAQAGDVEIQESLFYHFGVVVDGAIYRSSQPDLAFLEKMKKDVGLKTIISLRSLDDRPGYIFEREFAVQHGIALFEFPLNAKNPDASLIEKAYERLNDPGNYPVLIHCRAGTDRTGLLIALYRIRHGWSLKQAKREMSKYDHWSLFFPNIHRYLKNEYKKNNPLN